jgi:hypothetical protein
MKKVKNIRKRITTMTYTGIDNFGEGQPEKQQFEKSSDLNIFVVNSAHDAHGT